MLLIVRQEMLDAGSHVFALHTRNQRARYFGGNIGVFGIIFKIPAAQRRTLDVHRRPQNHAHAFRLAFLSQRLSHLRNQLPVEAGRRAAARREADRLDAVVHAQIIRFLILLSQAVRSVGNHHRRNSQTFHRLRVPEVRARTHRRLFFQRHFCYKFLQSFPCHITSISAPLSSAASRHHTGIRCFYHHSITDTGVLISFLTFYRSILTFSLRFWIIYLYFREISYLIQTFVGSGYC